MKKILLIIFFLELIIFINPFNFIFNTSLAQTQDIVDNKNEIIDSQKDNLNISSFIEEAEEYTKETMPEIDLNNLLTTAISGDIDNVKLAKLFWSLLRKRSIKFSRSAK